MPDQPPKPEEAKRRSDWVQKICRERARELHLSDLDISNASGVPVQHVSDYLGKRASMGSHKLQHLLRALKLDIKPEDDHDQD